MCQQLKLADFLEQLVLRPRIGWRFEHCLLDVDETGFFEPGDVVGIPRDGAVVVCGGFDDEVGPVGKAALGGEGGVVGGEAAVEFLEFEVAARFGVSVGWFGG